MRPWTDTQITERNREIQEGVRQCEIALADLDKPTAGHRRKENTMDPITAFEEATEKLVAKGMTKERAIGSLIEERPEMHEAYLEAYNAKHGVNRRSGYRRVI